MTLNEYIEKVKAENNITYTTKEIANYIRDCARKQKEGDCAVLDDETVKNLILTYDPSKAPKKEIKATVVSSENKKTAEEIQKEAIADAEARAKKKAEDKARVEADKKWIEEEIERKKKQKKEEEDKKRGWEQMGLGFWNV